MIGTLLGLSTLLFLCRAQTDSAPGIPVVKVINQPEGIAVSWETATNMTILTQRVEYFDSEGRRREVSMSPSQRTTVLIFVQPCKVYTVQVTVVYQNGAKLTSEPQEIARSAIAIPPTTSDLKLKEHGASYELSWTLPRTDVPISKINILGHDDNGEMVHQPAMYDQTKAILTSFRLDHSYNLTMTTENSCGASNESEAVRLEAISKPETPVISGTVPGLKKITVEFEKGETSDRVDQFHVNYTTPNGTVLMHSLPGTSGSVVLTEDIQPCVKYEINLWATNGVGASNVARVMAYAFSTKVPRKPSNLTVGELDGQAFLQWDSQSGEAIKGHEIAITDISSGASRTEYQEGDMSKLDLSNTKRCRRYRLKVRSENRCGWSAFSPEIQLTLQPSEKPTSPTQLAVSGTSNSLRLKWLEADSKQMLEQYDLLLVHLMRGPVTYWIPPKAIEFVLTGLENGAAYALSLEAKNPCGWSDPVDMLIQIGQDGSVSPLSVNSYTRAVLKRARRAIRSVI